MGVAQVGLVHCDPCKCKVKGFRAVSSIERNVSNRRHLQGLRQLGPSHQWGHKSRASLRGPPCAHGVAGTPQGEVRDTHPHQMESMSSSTILVVGTPILKLPSSLGVALCFLRARPLQCISQYGKASKGVVPRWSV